MSCVDATLHTLRLPCIALHCIALHCIALQLTAAPNWGTYRKSKHTHTHTRIGYAPLHRQSTTRAEQSKFATDQTHQAEQRVPQSARDPSSLQSRTHCKRLTAGSTSVHHKVLVPSIAANCVGRSVLCTLTLMTVRGTLKAGWCVLCQKPPKMWGIRSDTLEDAWERDKVALESLNHHRNSIALTGTISIATRTYRTKQLC